MNTALPCLCILIASTLATAATDDTARETASVDGNYSQLLQILHCPQDAADYGNFQEFGYWDGGPWCGQTGMPGYWVWVYPNWYIWKDSKGAESASDSNRSGTTIYNYDGGGSYVGGKNCSYVSAGGMSVKVCE